MIPVVSAWLIAVMMWGPVSVGKLPSAVVIVATVIPIAYGQLAILLKPLKGLLFGSKTILNSVSTKSAAFCGTAVHGRTLRASVLF